MNFTEIDKINLFSRPSSILVYKALIAISTRLIYYYVTANYGQFWLFWGFKVRFGCLGSFLTNTMNKVCTNIQGQLS